MTINLRKMHTMKTFLIAALILGLASCSSKVDYIDPEDADPQDTLNFSVSDVDEVTRQLTEKMLESRYVQRLMDEDGRKVIAIDDMRNKTTDYIDVDAITEEMVTAVINSGQFRVADRSKIENLKQEAELEDLGFVDPAQGAQIGKAIGLDLLLYGRITSFEARGNDGVDVAYRVSMRLLDIERNEIVWADRGDVRKVKEESWF